MHSITIPRLGWSMEEGIFGKWLKQPGEMVRSGDLLFELEGEKAASEIESLDSGILCIPADAPGPGDRVLVGQTIAFLLDNGETAPATVGPIAQKNDSVANSVSNDTVGASTNITISRADRMPRPSTGPEAHNHLDGGAKGERREPRVMGPAARRLARQLGINPSTSSASTDPTGRLRSQDLIHHYSQSSVPIQGKRIVATPRARRTASQLSIDLRLVPGSGRGGRIRERDVLAVSATLNTQSQPQSFQAQAIQPQTIQAQQFEPQASGILHPASKLRRAIATRVVAATLAAPVTLTTQVDADRLVETRQKWKAESPSSSDVPTIGDMIVKLVADTLAEDPTLNACWLQEGVWQYDQINLSIAIDTPAGLLAPVIENADKLSLNEVSKSTRQLAEQARQGTLRENQLIGGTFSISNLGMLGIDGFTPLLNLPQAAILGVGRIVQKPVIRNVQVVVGHVLTLSLTFDHRVTDGAPAARWLQSLCQRISRYQAMI
ncbi:MAG: dihydrolipoamide acetyltransferase family protein [Pirellulales bacterium]